MSWFSKSDEEAIFAAVRSGDPRAVSSLLASKSSLAREKNRHGWTVLHEAVASGHAEIVKLLLANGAKLSAKYDERTLLHEAVGCITGIAHPEVVQILLVSHRMNPNAKDKMGNTPLHCAVRWSCRNSKQQKDTQDTVELLLSNGADPNTYNHDKRTPLHLAANCGIANNMQIIELLIAYKANLDAEDQYGFTALHIAAIDGGIENTEILIAKGAHVNARDINCNTPLHDALYNRHKEIIIILLAQGANVDAQNESGNSPLHSLAGSTLQQDIDLAELLVTNKAALNLTDKDGSTPLHIAARYGQKAFVEFLLRHGADAKKRDTYSRTAMHIAESGGREDIAKILAIYQK